VYSHLPGKPEVNDLSLSADLVQLAIVTKNKIKIDRLRFISAILAVDNRAIKSVAQVEKKLKLIYCLYCYNSGSVIQNAVISEAHYHSLQNFFSKENFGLQKQLPQ
jgi:hypothetical protein